MSQALDFDKSEVIFEIICSGDIDLSYKVPSFELIFVIISYKIIYIRKLTWIRMSGIAICYLENFSMS